MWLDVCVISCFLPVFYICQRVHCETGLYILAGSHFSSICPLESKRLSRRACVCLCMCVTVCMCVCTCFVEQVVKPLVQLRVDGRVSSWFPVHVSGLTLSMSAVFGALPVGAVLASISAGRTHNCHQSHLTLLLRFVIRFFMSQNLYLCGPASDFSPHMLCPGTTTEKNPK